jgi:phosphoenolpyruvate synthase/pyruvate phosphate dikinase
MRQKMKGKLMMISHSKATYIHTKQDSSTTPQEIGGKATQIHNIAPNLIPDWVAITADCPDDALSEVVHEAVWELRNHAAKSYENLRIFLPQDKYAVRSSALAEDGEKQSYAGIFESKLNVPITGIEHAVREVRDSANTARVNEYRKDNYPFLDQRLLPDDRYAFGLSNIAVIIMPMVDAKYSGVLFTKEPLGGTDSMLVEYEKGVGGVVDGTRDTSHMFLDREDMLAPPWDGDGEMSVFHRQSLYVIWKEAKRLENNYGKPLDIEWAIDKNGKPWVLQVRPITTDSRYVRFLP